MDSESIEIRPIYDADLAVACAFMRETLAPSVTLQRWVDAFSQPWSSEKPNNGFMMLADGKLVGVQGAMYARRRVSGREANFCNLTSWSVRPPYRGKSLLVLSAATKQKGFTFTNFSPLKSTEIIFQRLKFKTINCDRWVIVNIPRTAERPLVGNELLQSLDDRSKTVLAAHNTLPGVFQFGFRLNGEVHHIIFTTGSFRKAPVATIVYASNWAALDDMIREVTSIIARTFRFALTMVEKRRLSRRPTFALATCPWDPCFYRSEDLNDEDIDPAYSEVVSLFPRA